MSGHHTASPWLDAAKPSSIVGWPVVGPEGRLICNIAWQPKPEHIEAGVYDAFYRECQANARLIAAAPELLGALINARSCLYAAVSANVDIEGFDPAEHIAIKRADAAIAKATSPSASIGGS